MYLIISLYFFVSLSSLVMQVFIIVTVVVLPALVNSANMVMVIKVALVVVIPTLLLVVLRSLHHISQPLLVEQV